MRSLQVVGLGMSTVDILMRLTDMPTWERGIRLSALKLDGGGPVGTALAAASRLGIKTGFVGTAGSDEVGALKLKFLTREGIDTSRVLIRPEAETQVVLVYVNETTGERVFSSAGGFSKDLLKVAELDREYITSADYLHLDGFHSEAALQAARWMRKAGKKVVLDAGKTEGRVEPPFRELVGLTDALICGSGFTRALTGVPDIWEAGKSILQMGPQVVVETHGAEGSYTMTSEEVFHIPAFLVDVLDTTGAGDVFHGAYLAGLIKGWDVRRTAVFATAVAAIKCTRLGGRSGCPYLHEVEEFLEKHFIGWGVHSSD